MVPVGFLCGIVCSVYESVMKLVLHAVWMEGGPAFAAAMPGAHQWTFILLVCTTMGAGYAVCCSSNRKAEVWQRSHMRSGAT